MEIQGKTDEELIENAKLVSEEHDAFVHMDILPSLGGKPRARLTIGKSPGPQLNVVKHIQTQYNFNQGQWNEA